ncbi:MAG: hypothetical protein HKN19_07335 [Halioglobus sp.]|nr:hypothetical protein [Halioglobus sp.]
MNSWSTLVRRAPWAAVLLCLAAGAWAAGSPYGEEFVRYGHDRADTAPALSGFMPSAEPVEPGDGAELIRQVEALESAFGPYADGLDEPLGSLGRHYLATGELGRALEVFTRAMHIVRVNEGLDSQRQMPVLRAMLDTYRLSGDHAALDERYDYYYTMLGAGEPPYTDVRLQAALAYLRWQREALRLEVDKNAGRRLLALLRHNENLIDNVARDDTLAPQWQAALALSQVKNYYLLQELVDEPDPVYTSRHVAPIPEIGRTQRNPVLDELERRRSGVRRLGASALENALLDLPQGTEPMLRARLLLALGDWYQWHGDLSSAKRYYAQTVSTLADGGREDLLLQWLGEPVELPDNGVFFQPAFGESVPAEHGVPLQFNVSASGRVTNVGLAGQAEPERKRDAQRLLRRIRGTRFRPRWAGGFAEPTAQVTRRYVWLD